MNSYAHKSDETHPWELLWVHFNGPAAEDYYQYYINTCNNVFHVENPEEYVSLINQLISTSQKKEASWELISSRLITDLLTTCIVNNSQQLSSGSSLIINKLYKIKDYLDQNYGQKLLLEDLANKFYISKFHLCREYKKLFGITVNDSITLKRITNAKELLRFTKMSIENISTESGYPDASYFNKVFQKVEGMSASDYRKKW
jgi:AraC-type DNA-binding domain-containing proteins